MRIINKTKNTVLAENAEVADTTLRRIKGLLGKKSFLQGRALILRPCNSIHTFFMQFAIDVIFVDFDHEIIFAQSLLKPWRVTPIFWKAKYAIELPCGVISQSLTTTGDEIGLI